MEDSYVKTNNKSFVAVGPDATAMYAAATLASALKLYDKCGLLPSSRVSLRAMLDRATQITRKTYTKKQAKLAADDVALWAHTMSAALPHLDMKGNPL